MPKLCSTILALCANQRPAGVAASTLAVGLQLASLSKIVSSRKPENPSTNAQNSHIGTAPQASGCRAQTDGT